MIMILGVRYKDETLMRFVIDDHGRSYLILNRGIYFNLIPSRQNFTSCEVAFYARRVLRTEKD